MEFNYQMKKSDIFKFWMSTLHPRFIMIITLIFGIYNTYNSMIDPDFKFQTYSHAVLALTVVVSIIWYGTFFLIYFLVSFAAIMAAKVFRMKKDALQLQKHHVTFTEGNYECQCVGMASCIAWECFDSVEVTQGLLLLWLKGRMSIHFIPVRFLTPEAIEFVKARVQAAKNVKAESDKVPGIKND